MSEDDFGTTAPKEAAGSSRSTGEVRGLVATSGSRASQVASTGFDRFGGDVRVRFESTGYFRIEKVGARWHLVTPDGHPFFIVGIAHVDDSALKSAESLEIYRARYGSRDRWISDCVVASLRDWGFNAIAWTRQVVTPGRRHSPEWTPDEYRVSGLPYIPHIDFLAI